MSAAVQAAATAQAIKSDAKTAAPAPAPESAAAQKEDAGSSFDGPTLPELKACLIDETAPIAKRMRTVFFLKQIGGLKAIEVLALGLSAESVLLSHEAAYVLGQMQDVQAVPFLEATLRNLKLNPITRHEAAEALGALGLESNSAILTEFCNDKAVEVSETCKIAIARLQWLKAKEQADAKDGKVPFHSVDPAPPAKEHDIAKLTALLNDRSKTLFERYRAMFRLRNIGTAEAVLALASGFTGADSIENGGSAVFRHEICYVMGQLRHAASIPSLTARLMDAREHAMVRHEAAEALGAIAGVVAPEDAKRCEPLLNAYLKDADKIVSESCNVALDISDYWSSDQFDSAGAGAGAAAPDDAAPTAGVSTAAHAAAAAPTKPAPVPTVAAGK